MFPGLRDRLVKELSTTLESSSDSHSLSINVNVIAPDERRYTAWIGGSILATLATFPKDMWITREEYDESGPTSVNRICV